MAQDQLFRSNNRQDFSNISNIYTPCSQEKQFFRFFNEGTAGDSLALHRGQGFTTKDRDNDKRSSKNCALQYKGAWWYNNCHSSNLNGLYLNGKATTQGMTWYHWKKAYYSVKKSEMKIRPQNFQDHSVPPIVHVCILIVRDLHRRQVRVLLLSITINQPDCCNHRIYL